MPNPEHEFLVGRSVRFRARDIHLPEPRIVLEELHGGDLLEGTVVDLSDSGDRGGAYLVVQIPGLAHPCVVAAERILRAV